ncbi:MAG TPA: glycosyltransferase [Candidatus Saccharimonadia bacterium]|nr:glycosyltransferase [Candidatus Saccharimonadia bacterium]
MKKALTLSIVIPVFNESLHLNNCLKAINKQTMAPKEVVVVDNNSTDNTRSVTNKYKFVKLIHESRQGVVFARDAGFNATSTDIICRIDADTILPKNWVEAILNFYSKSERKNYAWTCQGRPYNIKHSKTYAWLSAQVIFRLDGRLLGHYPLLGFSSAITQDQWRKVKNLVCHRNDIHEDLDLSIHLKQLGFKIYYDRSIQVGVELKRVFTEYSHLWPYLLLWPRTLRAHKLKNWSLAYIGAVFIYASAPVLIAENILAIKLTGKVQ